MSFLLGDRVRVIATRFGAAQTGKTGVVIAWEPPSYNLHLNVRIQYDTTLGEDCWENTYEDSDLELFDVVKKKGGFGAFLERHAL